MEFVKFIVICLLISAVFNLELSRHKKIKNKLRLLSEIGTKMFRVEALSVAEASKKFYASLHEKLKKLQTKNGGKIENSAWIGVGYNIAYGNPMIAPADGKLVDAGFTSPIFKQTFDKGNKTPDETYSFPDGYSVQPSKVCKTNFSSKVIKNLAKLKKSLNSSLQSDVTLFGDLAFSANTEFISIYNAIKKDEKVYIHNTATCALYRAVVDRYDPPQFTDNFLRALETLKGKIFTEEPSPFYEFINTFGTHYMYEIMMGSRYTYVSETNIKAYDELKKANVNIPAQAKYSAMLSLEVKKAVEADTKATNEFSKAVTDKLVTSVGAPMPSSMEVADWLTGTAVQPMPISYSLKPLTELFNNSGIHKKLSEMGIQADELEKNLLLANNKYCNHLVDTKKIDSCYSSALVPVDLSQESTDPKPDQEGSILALTDHQVQCKDNSAINSFQLKREGDKISYSFKCAKSDYISNKCHLKQTTHSAISDAYFKKYQKSAPFLDRHPIACDEDTVLKRFQLDTEGDQIFFRYLCCNAQVKNCSRIITPETDKTDDSIFSLANQVVDAKESNVLSSVHLVTGEKTYKYEITVCEF
jgi:hypothetical protein